jgi:hypothetical protein
LTAILLFAALAFFAFGQAAVARSGAQSAADAAALAAAQAARDEAVLELGNVIGSEHDWLDWLDLQADGGLPESEAGVAAGQLAADNDSAVTGIQQKVVGGHPGFRVAVETNYTVGDSVIPGTESMRARAAATAVIKPRCEFDPNTDPAKPVELVCDHVTVDIDPEDFDPDNLPDASVMFSVHLAE